MSGQLANCSTNVSSFEVRRPVLPIANSWIAAYLIIIVLAAIIFNGVVLISFLLKRKRLSTFQVCIFSVCFCDILFSIVLHPMSIATALGYDSDIVFSESGCLFFAMFALAFGTFDMVAHCIIAIIRYVNICHPTAEFLSKSQVKAMIAGAVVYSFVWSSGPLFSWGKFETFEVGCTIAFEDDPLVHGRAYVSCAFVFVFLAPLAVTVGCYIAILITSARQKNALTVLGCTVTTKTNRLNLEMRLVRLTSATAACYMICWAPYAVVCMWQAYGDAQNVPRMFRILAALFCKAATLTNPLLYLLLSRVFRKQTLQAFGFRLDQKREKRNSNSTHLSYSSRQTSSNCSTSISSIRLSHLSRRTDRRNRNSSARRNAALPKEEPALNASQNESAC